eukprot:14652907-Alexandrium_andersonii.AAC.1
MFPEIICRPVPGIYRAGRKRQENNSPDNSLPELTGPDNSLPGNAKITNTKPMVCLPGRKQFTGIYRPETTGNYRTGKYKQIPELPENYLPAAPYVAFQAIS